MNNPKAPPLRTTTFKFVDIPYDPANPVPDYSAHYLAWLAYPKDEQADKRKRFILACIAGCYKAFAPGKHAPEYMRGLKEHNIVNTINQGFKRIDKHRVMAYLAAHQQMEKGLSFNASQKILASRVHAYPNIAEVAEHAVTNAKQRNWKESVPTLAMVFGMPANVFRTDEFPLRTLLVDARWVPEAIELAHEVVDEIAIYFKPPVLLVPRFKTTQILKSADHS